MSSTVLGKKKGMRRLWTEAAYDLQNQTEREVESWVGDSILVFTPEGPVVAHIQDQLRTLSWPGDWVRPDHRDDPGSLIAKIADAAYITPSTPGDLLKLWENTHKLIISSLLPGPGLVSSEVAQVVGERGLPVLGDVVECIRRVADNNSWSLPAIQLKVDRDPEVVGSEYVLVVLKLRMSLDDADDTMQSLYPEIEKLAGSLQEDSRELLLDKIYFDVEPV